MWFFFFKELLIGWARSFSILLISIFPVTIYLFKVNNRNITKRHQICLNLTLKNTRMTSLTSFWCFYCLISIYFTTFTTVTVVDFEQVNVNWVKSEYFCDGSDKVFLFWNKISKLIVWSLSITLSACSYTLFIILFDVVEQRSQSRRQ